MVMLIYKPSSDGSILRGAALMAFSHSAFKKPHRGSLQDEIIEEKWPSSTEYTHDNEYKLVPVEIYADGEISCMGPMDFDSFVERVRSGGLVASVPKEAVIICDDLFYCAPNSGEFYVSDEDFILQVKDALDMLRGGAGSRRRCKEAFLSYLKSPSDEKRDALRKEYGLVPNHMKQHLLDPPHRDSPIQYLLTHGEFSADKLYHWRVSYLNSNPVHA